MHRLGIDIETYSDRDIGDCGAYAYAESPAFQILLIAYIFDTDREPTVIDLSSYGRDEAVEYVAENYPEFYKALKSPQYTKTAYNANFERTCLARYFGEMKPYQWWCTAVHASMMGLPRHLADVGPAIGLPEDKQKMAEGKALIQYFCKPCKPTKANGGRERNLPIHAPDKWELFKKYNAQDVVAEQAILAKLNEYGDVAYTEKDLWCFDQRMNDRGVLLDVAMVGKIIDYDAKNTEKLMVEAMTITGLQNPNSLSQLKKWLNDQGMPMEQVTKETVAAALTLKYIPDHVRRVLEIRQALGKTSTKKYQAMLKAVCADDRLRGVLQFYGANRSGRWAGRIVQVHNLPQNKFPDIDLCRELASQGRFEDMELLFGELPFAFSQLVRTAFIASPGNTFIVSDFSAIEARVIAWLAGEQWRIKVFEEGGDIYCASASQMFHVPVVKHGENGHLRQRGKVAELALGYQGGVGAMARMDTTGTIPQEDMPGIVQSWREASPKIVRLWYDFERAARTAILERRKIKLDKGIEFEYTKGVMFIKLPGGRRLAYWDARIEEMADGREHITYGGVNQETKKWERAETYGGKLVENVVQATARDLLAYCMMKVEAKGYDIAFHIHDEMIVDVPDEKLEEAKAVIDDIMSTPPKWAKGLPLRGDGYTTKHYKKD